VDLRFLEFGRVGAESLAGAKRFPPPLLQVGATPRQNPQTGRHSPSTPWAEGTLYLRQVRRVGSTQKHRAQLKPVLMPGTWDIDITSLHMWCRYCRLGVPGFDVVSYTVQCKCLAALGSVCSHESHPKGCGSARLVPTWRQTSLHARSLVQRTAAAGEGSSGRSGTIPGISETIAGMGPVSIVSCSVSLVARNLLSWNHQTDKFTQISAHCTEARQASIATPVPRTSIPRCTSSTAPGQHAMTSAWQPVRFAALGASTVSTRI
jgi:hypothetical protein